MSEYKRDNLRRLKFRDWASKTDTWLEGYLHKYAVLYKKEHAIVESTIGTLLYLNLEDYKIEFIDI